jgi:hypothetical protein
MKYLYKVSPEAITKKELLTEQGIDTASPIDMDYPSELQGQKVSVCGCWVSTSGVEGPYGPVVSFTIP